MPSGSGWPVHRVPSSSSVFTYFVRLQLAFLVFFVLCFVFFLLYVFGNTFYAIYACALSLRRPTRSVG